MSSQAWKDLERTAARKLHGIRKLKRSLHWGIKDSDVAHPIFEIDCKYGSTVPVKLHNLVREDKSKIHSFDGIYFVCTLDRFVEALKHKDTFSFVCDLKIPKWYFDVIEKIELYSRDRQLVPLVVSKRPREQMEIVVCKTHSLYLVSDYYRVAVDAWDKAGYYKNQNGSIDEIALLPYYRLNGNIVDGKGRPYIH